MVTLKRCEGKKNPWKEAVTTLAQLIATDTGVSYGWRWSGREARKSKVCARIWDTSDQERQYGTVQSSR